MRSNSLPRHYETFISHYSEHAHNYSKTTKSYSILCIERFAKFLDVRWHSISLNDADSTMVEQWVYHMRLANLTYMTIYHNLKIMDKVYDCLIKAKIVHQNPIKSVRDNFPQPETGNRIINPIDFSQLLKFLKKRKYVTKRGTGSDYKGMRAYIIVKVLLETPLKLKEIFALRDEVVNLEQGIILWKGKNVHLSGELVNDLLDFRILRDKLIPRNSSWLINGMTGYSMNYHHFKKEFKEWSFLLGFKINSIKIKEQYFKAVGTASQDDSSFLKKSGFKTWFMLEKYRGPRKRKGPRFNVRHQSKKTL